jgi:uncharacterized protein with PQ loop repeat
MLLVMELDILMVVVVAANVLGGAMALPQAVKTVTKRRTDGLSPSWAGISTALNASWGVYAWGVGDWSIMPVSAFAVMTYLLIAVAMVRFRRGALGPVVGPMVASGLVALAIPMTVVVTAGWATGGVVLGAMYGIQLSPAVVAVHRARDVSGVSVATWALALAEAVLWTIYGVAVLDSGVLTLGAVGSVLSLLVLVRLLVKRPRRSRDTALAFAPA